MTPNRRAHDGKYHNRGALKTYFARRTYRDDRD